MRINAYVSILVGLCLYAVSSNAQNYTTCNQWDYWQIGNGYTIYNNIWGSGAGTQCLWAYDQGTWGVWANHPTTGGIKAYPNVDYDVNYTVSSMPTITASFNVSVPSSGSYNTAFDIWYNNYAYEVMLWVNYTGSMGPISYNYGCSGYPSTACPVATNISVGGHTWNLYQGTNGSATVFSFVRTGNTTSGTVNITSISQWLANNGYFSSSTNLHEIQFGFEITSSSGGANFIVNSYSLNIGSTTGSTGYVKLQNRNTGLYLDGMGRTANGANCGQYSGGSSYNQQWQVITSGSYVKFKNRSTGLFLDGMGRTTNGSITGQWSESSSYNQQWLQVASGSYYRYQNRATGLYLDGMGYTTNGADAGQWSSSSHYNQQWVLTTVSAREANEIVKSDHITFTELAVAPNPLHQGEQLSFQLPEIRKSVIIQIVDISGKLISYQKFPETNHILLNNPLEKGMYLVMVNQDGENTTHKLIVD